MPNNCYECIFVKKYWKLKLKNLKNHFLIHFLINVLYLLSSYWHLKSSSSYAKSQLSPKDFRMAAASDFSKGSQVKCESEDSRLPRVFMLDRMGRCCDVSFGFDAKFAKWTPIKTPSRVGFALSLTAGGNRSSTRDSYYYNIYRD